MNNIKKIYHHAGKFDDQQNLKDILFVAMVLTPEKVTDVSLYFPMTSTPVKTPSASKSLWLFTNILNVKNKTEKLRVGAEKYKRRSMKVGNSLCTNKRKLKGHSKINGQIKNVIFMHG